MNLPQATLLSVISPANVEIKPAARRAVPAVTYLKSLPSSCRYPSTRTTRDGKKQYRDTRKFEELLHEMPFGRNLQR